MAKYIDREALVEWLKRIPLKDLSDGRGLCRVIFEDDFKRAIKKIPKGIIVDVAPVRHGQWVQVIYHEEFEDGFVDRVRECCSVCHAPTWRITTNYCSNCGADMRGSNTVFMTREEAEKGLEAMK